MTSTTSQPNRVRAAGSAKRRAFTLVEILIVVVILGILATIVLPQFSNASKQARENTLKDDLRYLRTQIQVYKAQHREVSPGITGTFADQMTMHTDESGATSATPTAQHKFGPYLTKIPNNPLTERSGIRIVTTGEMTDTIDETYGWIYKPSTGEIIAEKSGNDVNDYPYVKY